MAEREAERQHRKAVREHSAALRRMEQARKADERARAMAARAAEADRKRLEKEAKAAHIAAMEAEVEERNCALAELYDEIDSMLAATLEVDDYVDLATLRRTAEHPPFDGRGLEAAISPPPKLSNPPKPVMKRPEKPRWPFGKRKYARALANAEADHALRMAAWNAKCDAVEAQRRVTAEAHERAERERCAALERERARYVEDCAARDREVAEHNSKIDCLVADLGYGTAEAIQEYISIVLANSVYPSCFPVTHEFVFDPKSAELDLRVLVPPPKSMPMIKGYKYTRSSDQIAETTLSQAACKARYSGAVHQVALRSMHEVFEADRRGLIRTISLEVGAEAMDPATGNAAVFPFVIVSADREKFLAINLSAVVPAATLEHLGAAVSKDPFGLVAVDRAGVRRS